MESKWSIKGKEIVNEGKGDSMRGHILTCCLTLAIICRLREAERAYSYSIMANCYFVRSSRILRMGGLEVNFCRFSSYSYSM